MGESPVSSFDGYYDAGSSGGVISALRLFSQEGKYAALAQVLGDTHRGS